MVFTIDYETILKEEETYINEIVIYNGENYIEYNGINSLNELIYNLKNYDIVYDAGLNFLSQFIKYYSKENNCCYNEILVKGKTAYSFLNINKKNIFFNELLFISKYNVSTISNMLNIKEKTDNGMKNNCFISFEILKNIDYINKITVCK